MLIEESITNESDLVPSDPSTVENYEKSKLRELSKHLALSLDEDLDIEEDTSMLAAERASDLPNLNWEELGFNEPKILPFPKPPPGQEGGWKDYDALPEADVVVMTWTSAEWRALHYVLSNKLAPLKNRRDNTWQNAWYPYRKDFCTVYNDLWMRRLVTAYRNRPTGTPSLNSRAMRWGSFCLVEVEGKKVLLFKSDLHINTDGESLPLRQLVKQIALESKPNLILSVGTSGGTRLEDNLGDVMVTNSAKFRLGDEFKSASFNNKQYRSSWQAPTSLIERVEEMLPDIGEYTVEPPTAHYEGQIRPNSHRCKIKVVDAPILTTDFFEYGTTTNNLGQEGCCVEMDDAVIAMVLEEMNSPIEYGFLRNCSDPVINGHMPKDLQVAWAVVSYQKLGFETSFNSAMATWAMIAGD